MESFWFILKRAHKGTFHKISPKNLQCYVSEFVGKHNIRDSDTIAKIRDTFARLDGRNLLHRDLVACNGLPSGTRSQFPIAQQRRRLRVAPFRSRPGLSMGNSLIAELSIRQWCVRYLARLSRSVRCGVAVQ